MEGTTQTWKQNLGEVQRVARGGAAGKCGAGLCVCMPHARRVVMIHSQVDPQY